MYFICWYAGPHLEIYQSEWSEDGVHSFGRCASTSPPHAQDASQSGGATVDVPYENDDIVRIVLEVGDDGVGHFSRLLDSSEWQKMDEGCEDETFSDSDESSATSSSSNGTKEDINPGVSSNPHGADAQDTSVKGTGDNAICTPYPRGAKQNKSSCCPTVRDDKVEDDCDSLSDVSDGPDANDVKVLDSKSFTTLEDRDLERIDTLKCKMRAKPLLPCDPRDTEQAYVNMASGVRLPILHCAFKGCKWTRDFGQGTNKDGQATPIKGDSWSHNG